MDLFNIYWEYGEEHFKNVGRKLCEYYEKECVVERQYEEERMVGFYAYRDDKKEGIRYLMAWYGRNDMAPGKWKRLVKGKKVRSVVQKTNERLIDFYRKLKFEVVNSDYFNVVFERSF